MSGHTTDRHVLKASGDTLLITELLPHGGVGSNRPFQILDLYWRSPESGDVWYTSRKLER